MCLITAKEIYDVQLKQRRNLTFPLNTPLWGRRGGTSGADKHAWGLLAFAVSSEIDPSQPREPGALRTSTTAVHQEIMLFPWKKKSMRDNPRLLVWTCAEAEGVLSVQDMTSMSSTFQNWEAVNCE